MSRNGRASPALEQQPQSARTQKSEKSKKCKESQKGLCIKRTWAVYHTKVPAAPMVLLAPKLMPTLAAPAVQGAWLLLLQPPIHHVHDEHVHQASERRCLAQNVVHMQQQQHRQAHLSWDMYPEAPNGATVNRLA